MDKDATADQAGDPIKQEARRPSISRRRSSLLSAFSEPRTINGYFCPKLSTFFVVTPDAVKE